MRQFIVHQTKASRGRVVWNVTVGNESYGYYLSEFDALLDAVDAAYEAGLGGDPCQVVAKAKDGTHLVKWTYGSDAYPYLGTAAKVDGAV